MFRGIAKWIGEATEPDQVPELIARAYAMAMGGVPGPVVLSLPEDVLAMECRAPLPPATAPLPRAARAGRCGAARGDAARGGAADPARRARLRHAGTGRWRRAALRRFAEAWNLPVAVSFRRQDLFPNDHPLYAGDLGLRNPDAQRAAFAEADLVLALGTRLTDITTQGWTWPAAGQRTVHVCADPRFLGWLFPAELAIAADARATIAALAAETPAAPAAPRRLDRAAARPARRRLRGRASATHPDGIAFAEVAKLDRARRARRCDRDAGCRHLRRALLPQGGLAAGAAPARPGLRRHGLRHPGGRRRGAALPGADRDRPASAMAAH